jgi:hypothetical protein
MIRLGAVLEFRAPQGGFVYAQYARDGLEGEQLLRALPGVHEQRPDDLQAVVDQPERFWEQLQISAVLDDGYACIAGHADVPLTARAFPLFRSPTLPDPFTRRVETWRIWDDKEVCLVSVDEMSRELWGVSIGGYSSRDDFVNRIASGWTPRDEVVDTSPGRSPEEIARLRMTHVLRYESETAARRAGQVVSADLDEVEVVLHAHEGWLLLWREPVTEWNQERSEQMLRRLAHATGGTYEGYHYPQDSQAAGDARLVRHFLIFADERSARRAADRMQREDFHVVEVEVAGGDWSVVAERTAGEDERDDDMEILEDIAEAFGGDYIGDEIATGDE